MLGCSCSVHLSAFFDPPPPLKGDMEWSLRRGVPSLVPSCPTYHASRASEDVYIVHRINKYSEDGEVWACNKRQTASLESLQLGAAKTILGCSSKCAMKQNVGLECLKGVRNIMCKLKWCIKSKM